MKHLLFILSFFMICQLADAQLPCNNLITFDPGDTLYPVEITIDTIHYHHNIWQVGAPHKTEFTSAYSLPNAIVTDTVNPYPINDTSVFTLKVTSNFSFLTQLEFYYQLDKDSGSVAILEISEDSGLHWINYSDSLPTCFSYNGGVPANLSLPTTGWMYFLLVGDYLCRYGTGGIPSNYFLFRFTFISDSVHTTKDGWMIDNIDVNYWCDSYVPNIQNNNALTIFPNPSTATITITAPTDIATITITNLLGQTLYTNKYNSPQVQIDVSSLPSGIYFVKVNGTEVRKFVKQ